MRVVDFEYTRYLMSANSILNIDSILIALQFLAHLLVTTLTARRIKEFFSPAFWLWGYASLAFSLFLLKMQLAGQLFPVPITNNHWHLEESISLLMCLLLFQCLLSFLGKDFQPTIFFGGLAFCTTAIVLNDLALILIAGMFFILLDMLILFRCIARTHQPLHRNRLYFWVPLLLLAAGNQLSLYYLLGAYAGEFRLGAGLILFYLVLRYHIPDVRDFLRQFIINLLTTLLSIVVYIVGFLLADNFLRNLRNYDPLIVGAGVAVFVSLLYTIQYDFMRRMVNKIFRIQSYDPSLILSRYGESISNILELDKLAAVAMGMIVQVFAVEKGFLFLIDPEIGDGDQKIFRVSGARGVGHLANPRGVFSSESPVISYFLEYRSPLLQYDIDFAPEFMSASLEERKWLSSLGMDVYVPIFSKGEWIGLFALGSKPENRYTSEDLQLLAAIASQTGVALENARLVENLKNLNQQVNEAYASLDKTNQILTNLELTKSNFISIASHELRTPLTAARGYTEMLLEDENIPSALRLIVQGIHKSIMRQHEIMDSMFEIAQLDTRSGEFHPEDTFVNDVIRNVADEISKLVAERAQTIIIDLPQLPVIKADPDSLRKLFWHLMMNAVKFTPNNGCITVAGVQLPINGHDLPEGGVEIVISDTGVGVAQEFQEIIFTRFFQPGELLNLHSTGKTKFKGSGIGLGLALARSIVEAHGGRIWVESEGYDEQTCPGSHFHVMLPFRQQGEIETIRMGSAVKLKI
jgi:signal transduction histidine kinase